MTRLERFAVLACALPLLAAGAARAQDCGSCDQPGSVGCDTGGSPGGAVLGHYQCYGLNRHKSVNRAPLTLVDRYGTLQVDFCKLSDACIPADKNGEDPSAIDSTSGFAEYRLKRQPFQRIQDQTFTNQFGTFVVDVLAPRSLLVPSDFSGSGGGNGSADGALLPHFTCYDVTRGGGNDHFTSPGTVQVETQFETVSVRLHKPWRVCVPTDKNGEDPQAPQRNEALVCYWTSSRTGFGSETVSFSNQFGDQSAVVNTREALCVPSHFGSGTTTTTTIRSTTTTSASSSTTTSSSTTAPSSSTSTTTSTTTSTSLGSAMGALLGG